MAEMMFDNREAYINMITELLNKANLIELDKFLRVMVKHYWPNQYV